MAQEIDLMMAELKTIIDKSIFRPDPEKTYSEGLEPGYIYGKPVGKVMQWQFFGRKFTHDWKGLYIISQLLVADLLHQLNEGKLELFQLCGLETASLPLIGAIQTLAASKRVGINAFTVRKERKGYGLFNLIEGTPTPNVPVVFIDDIFNSGSSARQCFDAAYFELKLPPAPMLYSVVNFSEYGAMKYERTGQEIQIRSLFKKTDFDLTYSKEKYWLPMDCDLSYNKRPEYQTGKDIR